MEPQVVDMDLSLYTERVYKTTRKAKMYLINHQNERHASDEVERLLEDGELVDFHLRFSYARFTPDSYTDLKTNYAQKLIQAFITWGLTRNVPYQFENVFCDHNHFIFDIRCQAEDRLLRQTLTFLFRHVASLFATTIECRLHTKDREIKVALESHRPGLIQEPLFTSEENVARFPPKNSELDVTPEFLKSYYEFLKHNYDGLYQDVKHRACTVWLARKGWGEYQPRRYLDQKPIFFPPTFEELESLLERYPVVAIVPNSTREDVSHPVELTIDIDPPTSMPFEVVRSTSNAFANWLTQVGFQYSRRLTGSFHGGQHFVLPIDDWTYPHLLFGKTELFRDYRKRTPLQILCDSVRCTADLLVLAFRQENPDLAPLITTKIFNPYVRFDRFLFDISINTYNRGRRALFSAHQKTLGICLPLNNECPSTRGELKQVVSLERLLTGETPVPTPAHHSSLVALYNTKLLKRFIGRYERLAIEYDTTVQERFEYIHFAMPLPGVPEDE